MLFYFFAVSEVGQQNPRICDTIGETKNNFDKNEGCTRRLAYLGSLTLQLTSRNTVAILDWFLQILPQKLKENNYNS